MAKKKDFSATPNPAMTNPAMRFISPQEDPTEEEKINLKEEAKESEPETKEQKTVKSQPVHKMTQGKKGAKLPRMNMAFSPENYEHIEIMSKMMGSNHTQYVNDLVAKDREEKKELVEHIKELRKGV